MSTICGKKVDLISLGLVIGMLISGSANTLSKKAQNDCSADDRDGDYVPFEHAWLQTATMFLGEFSCILGWFYLRCKNRNRRLSNHGGVQAEPFIQSRERGEVSITARPRSRPDHTCFQWIFLLPASLDLLGTTIAGVGLIYTYASVWQMLRGSIVIFTALLSKFFLGRKLQIYQYVGLLLTVIGLIFVGVAATLTSEEDSTKSSGDMIFGILLIVVGQFCSAVQMVVEEKFLKAKRFHPMHVVGMEGFFGLFMMVCVVLPITTYVIPAPPEGTTDIRSVFHDDVFDGLYMMANNLNILYFGLVYFASIGMYNVFGMGVAKKMSSVHRTLIDALRTTIVWSFDVILYYSGNGSFGEKLTYYSILQCFGFLLLIIGTLIYNKVLRLYPWCYKPKVRGSIKNRIEGTPVGDFSTPGIIRHGTPTLARVSVDSPEGDLNRGLLQ